MLRPWQLRFFTPTSPLASPPSLENELYFPSRAVVPTAILAFGLAIGYGLRTAPYCGETNIPGPSNADPRMPYVSANACDRLHCLQQPRGPGREHVLLCATMTTESRSSSTHAPRLPPLLGRLGAKGPASIYPTGLAPVLAPDGLAETWWCSFLPRPACEAADEESWPGSGGTRRTGFRFKGLELVIRQKPLCCPPDARCPL